MHEQPFDSLKWVDYKSFHLSWDYIIPQISFEMERRRNIHQEYLKNDYSAPIIAWNGPN